MYVVVRQNTLEAERLTSSKLQTKRDRATVRLQRELLNVNAKSQAV